MNNDASTSTATVAAATTSAATIEFLEDAHDPADDWVANHPERLAVSVRVGTGTPDNIVANIEPLLRQHFEANGVTEIEFFWEQGTAEGTGLAYHTDHYVFGPFGLHNALDHVSEAARRTRFDRQVALNR